MKSLLRMTLVATLTTISGLGAAQAADMPSKKPIVQTTCKDYLAMDEVLRPKFVYYTVGQTKRDKPETVVFDVVYLDKLVPSIDKYCRVHLTDSAYQRVIAESKASEPANVGAAVTKSK